VRGLEGGLAPQEGLNVEVRKKVYFQWAERTVETMSVVYLFWGCCEKGKSREAGLAF